MPGYRRWLGFGEGCFVELDEGTIIGILRADSLGQGYKVLSRDRGRSWSGPFATQMIGMEGRPQGGAAVLRRGVLHLPHRPAQRDAGVAPDDPSRRRWWRTCKPTVPRLPLPEDRPGVHDPSQPWYMREHYPGRTVILDQDRSVHRDCGYSGWVELPNGDLYVVDYCHDDAPRAHIRSYRVTREDIVLFPPGEIALAAPLRPAVPAHDPGHGRTSVPAQPHLTSDRPSCHAPTSTSSRRTSTTRAASGVNGHRQVRLRRRSSTGTAIPGTVGAMLVRSGQGSSRSADSLLADYRRVRSFSEELCRPLATEDYVVQSMDDVSPAKWHLGHVSWFFEAFLLAPELAGYEPFHPQFGFIFNSYYNGRGGAAIRGRGAACWLDPTGG